METAATDLSEKKMETATGSAIFVFGRGVTHRALVQRGPALASRPPAIAPFDVLNSAQSTVSSAPHGPLWRSLRRNLTSGILGPSRLTGPAVRTGAAAGSGPGFQPRAPEQGRVLSAHPQGEMEAAQSGEETEERKTWRVEWAKIRLNPDKTQNQI